MKQKHLELIVGGLGGHGVLLLGRLLIEAGMEYYPNVLFLPIYGGTVRLGDCECTVIMSHDEIVSPVMRNPELGIAMSKDYYRQLEPRVKPGGQLFVNSSVITETSRRSDIKIWYVPAFEIASAIGQTQVGNLVMLGAFLQATNTLPIESIDRAIEARLKGKKQALMELNKKALREGAGRVKQNRAG